MKYEIAAKLKQKRKAWSGEEIARAQIANNAHRFETQLPGEAGLVVPSEKVRQQLDLLYNSQDERQIAAYELYMSIFNWIWSTKGNSLTHVQQAQLRVLRLIHWAKFGRDIEQAYLIMMEKGDLAPLEPLQEFSLEAFFAGHPDAVDNAKAVEEDMRALMYSRKLLYGFNAALDIIANLYKLEDVEALKGPAESIDRHIDTYNNARAELLQAVKKDPDQIKRKQKEAVLDQVLVPIDYKKQIIPNSAIVRAREAAKNFEPFWNHTPFLEYLTGYKE